jgi:hypothetical protein
MRLLMLNGLMALVYTTVNCLVFGLYCGLYCNTLVDFSRNLSCSGYSDFGISYAWIDSVVAMAAILVT